MGHSQITEVSASEWRCVLKHLSLQWSGETEIYQQGSDLPRE
jgi:hypothetical protein